MTDPDPATNAATLQLLLQLIGGGFGIALLGLIGKGVSALWRSRREEKQRAEQAAYDREQALREEIAAVREELSATQTQLYRLLTEGARRWDQFSEQIAREKVLQAERRSLLPPKSTEQGKTLR